MGREPHDIDVCVPRMPLNQTGILWEAITEDAYESMCVQECKKPLMGLPLQFIIRPAVGCDINAIFTYHSCNMSNAAWSPEDGLTVAPDFLEGYHKKRLVFRKASVPYRQKMKARFPDWTVYVEYEEDFL